MKKKTIVAQTFTPLYDELEDRIRLIVNYKDMNNRIDIMITRSMIVKLVPMLEEYLEKNFYTIQQPKENSTQNTENTESDYIDFVLKEELLLQVDLSLQQDKQNIALIFTTKNTTVQSVLMYEHLTSLLESLKKSIPKFSWGIFI